MAKKVLAGQTKGYKNHPQLDRFKAVAHPVARIDQYLAGVYEEAVRRGYNFNQEKIDWEFSPATLMVHDKQLEYEMQHLLRKLSVRDPERYEAFSGVTSPLPHPLFEVVAGDIEDWEIVS